MIKPDVLFLGDSHVIALDKGARELGIQTESVQYSGNMLNLYGIGYRKRTIFVPTAKKGNKKVIEVQEKYDVADILDLGVPVITNLGFHLGRFISPFDWKHHKTYRAHNYGRYENEIVISNSFLTDYIINYRRQLLSFVKLMSERCDVLLVPPPKVKHVANYDLARQIIIDLMEKNNIPIFDPAHLIADESGYTPKELLESDGAHGTTEYGVLVMKELQQRGFIPQSRQAS